MVSPARTTALLVALAVPILAVGPADAKKKKPSCKPKKEKAGCVLKRAKFENATIKMRIEPKPFEFSFNLSPTAVVQTTVSCPGSLPGENFAAAAGTAKLPKIGKTYTWTQSGNGFSTKAKVTFKSAKKVTVALSGTTIAFNDAAEAIPCPVNVTGTLTRK